MRKTASHNDLNFKDTETLRDDAFESFDLSEDHACESTCDSWALAALYSKCPEKDEGNEDQMIVLNDKHAVLLWAVSQLSVSPTARSMIDEAQKGGWSIALQTLDGPDFHLDVPEKLIVLNNHSLPLDALVRSEFFKNTLLISFVRALRDVWQEKRHGAFDERYGAEDVLMLERVRAADLDVVAVLTAWELRGEGRGGLWRHLIGAEDGDIAMRFSGYLERDPSALFNGKALAEAFIQWFRDDRRVDACDHEALNYLDMVVCECEGGAAFGQEKLTPVGVEVLSCLPDKTAYLRNQGSEILSNPLYIGLGDTINQAHFAQIIYDLRVTRVQNVPFRDSGLANKIFPNGEFTLENIGEESDTIH